MRILLVREPGLEIEPIGKRNPDLVVLLWSLLHVSQDFIGSSDGLL